MNYTPNYVAKNLKTKNTRSIGVIAEDMTVFALPDIIDGITEYCEEADYQILLVNLRLYKKFQDNYYRDNRHKEIVRSGVPEASAKQVEGIIYVAAMTPDRYYPRGSAHSNGSCLWLYWQWENPICSGEGYQRCP